LVPVAAAKDVGGTVGSSVAFRVATPWRRFVLLLPGQPHRRAQWPKRTEGSRSPCVLVPVIGRSLRRARPTRPGGALRGRVRQGKRYARTEHCQGLPGRESRFPLAVPGTVG